MFKPNREIVLEENEILRISVRKDDLDSEEFDIDICYVGDDDSAKLVLEVFEEAMKKEVELMDRIVEEEIEEEETE